MRRQWRRKRRRIAPNIDFSYWSGETKRQKNRIFALGREGKEHTDRVGRPLARANVRNGEKFNERCIGLTPHFVEKYLQAWRPKIPAPEAEQDARRPGGIGPTHPGAVFNRMWEYDGQDEGVLVEVDDKECC